MTKKPFGSDSIVSRLPVAGVVRLLLVCSSLMILPARPALAADRQILHNHVPAAAATAAPIRQLSRQTNLNLTIGLPLRDREGLTNLLQQIYDPASANFRHYLTPEQFTQKFGPTDADYQAVVAFAQTHSLVVTARHSNRMVVSARGTAADIEQAFHVTLNEYRHPTEARTFYAPDADPSLDLTTPVLSINGLDNYVVPHPLLHPMALEQANPQLTGSGPAGLYAGKDFRAAYAPGVALTGAGQIVGLLEFDAGYYQNDITGYESQYGLPNVPVSAVLLDGYGGGAGQGNTEVSADIELAISMAPGLSGVLVYEGSSTDDILNQMAIDNLAKQIGASWTYGIDATSDQIFMQMAAQGQSFFNAAGDDDAYSGAVTTPADDPNITIVGGTSLRTSGAAGSWVSETVWNNGAGLGTGGGISMVNPIPVWQQGISMAANQGSTAFRNLPDVAMDANDVYVLYGNGTSGAFVGTSCSTPLWAGFTALVNQFAVSNGAPMAGFINPMVYAIGKGSNSLGYSNLFHDITVGNNESAASPTRFTAATGYDLCTGWGAPIGSNLITAIAFPEALRITPVTGLVFSGPLGGPFIPASQTFLLTNEAGGSLNWSLVNTSPLFDVTPGAGTVAQGGAAGVVTVSVTPAAAGMPAGVYSVPLQFTDLADSVVQTRELTLAVATPPMFLTNPFVEPMAGAGFSYAANMATNATDLNFGAVMTFSIFNGPPWLSVTPNGILSGVPLSTNVGNNWFAVKVTDTTGLYSFAAMSVNVRPVAPIELQITPEGTNLLLTWTGGIPPYQVTMTTNLIASPWQSIGNPVTTNRMALVPNSSGAYYQVRGQ